MTSTHGRSITGTDASLPCWCAGTLWLARANGAWLTIYNYRDAFDSHVAGRYIESGSDHDQHPWRLHNAPRPSPLAPRPSPLAADRLARRSSLWYRCAIVLAGVGFLAAGHAAATCGPCMSRANCLAPGGAGPPSQIEITTCMACVTEACGNACGDAELASHCSRRGAVSTPPTGLAGIFYWLFW